MNKQVDTFYQVDFSGLRFPLITVFFDPKDVPGKFVARISDLNQPTDTMIIKDSLEEIREAIPPNFNRILRNPEDHPSIVEVWI